MPFFGGPFGEPRELASAAEGLVGRPYPRAELAERLVRENRDLGAEPSALRNLAELGDSRTFAVVAGQQAGPYTGPLYTLYKALTTVLVARRLNACGATPRFVPLFWCASEDHDLDEINHVDLPEPTGGVRRISSGLMTTGAPAARTRVDEAVLAFHREVAAFLPPSEHRDTVFEALRPDPGESLSRWFSRSLLALLRGTGISILDPEWIRDLASPLLREAAERHREVEDALGRNAARLESAGFSPAIEAGQALRLFRIQEGLRRRIRPEGGLFRVDGSSRTLEPRELIAAIEGDPTSFSPDVVLRPIVQCAVLPAPIFVAGPSEVAYLGAIGEVFDLLGVPRPRVVPRISATLVTSRQARALAAFGLDPSSFPALAPVVPPGRSDGTPPASLPPGLAGPLEKIEGVLARELPSLVSGVAHLDSSASKGTERLARQVEGGVARLRERLREIADRAAGAGLGRWQRLRGELLPRGKLQERVYGPLPYLVRHGIDLAPRLASGLDPFDFRHRLLDPGAGAPASIPRTGKETP